MKLISYTINNNKFILLENIVIKIFKNTYNIYLNDSLYYSYNKKYFLKFIQENYNQYYQKINQLLLSKIKGGAEEVTKTDTPAPTVDPSAAPAVNPSAAPAVNPSAAPATESIVPSDTVTEEKKGEQNSAGLELNLILDNPDKSYYLFIFKLLLILSKIIPTDIKLETYVGKMYQEIKNKNPDITFTEQYLLNKINKKITKGVRNICNMENDTLNLDKYIPKKNDEALVDIKNLVENQLLLENIKGNIDTSDVKNKEDVHFQYMFNIKEEGMLWD